MTAGAPRAGQETRIVVLGAGYVGLTAVAQLAARTRGRDDVRITLVGAQEEFTERLRLHMAATGQRLADFRIPEFLEGTDVRFVRGWVTAVDADARTVRVDDELVLPYDTLVYALGGVTDTAGVAGVEEHAFTLDGEQEARNLSGRLARLSSPAVDGTATDGGRTVVVVGGGLTGVEAAAEIAESHPALDVVLLTREEPGAGAGLGAGARAHVRDALGRLGVTVRTGTEVTGVLPGAVELAGGETVAAGAVLWTAGVRTSPVAAVAGLDVDERGRVVTDATLRSVSHPQVYAVGDAAAVRQPYGFLHGTCQSGMPTGVHAAVSIVRQLRGKDPKTFRFGYYHVPVSLGRHDAVVQFTHPDGTPRRIRLTGRAAARYKETVTASAWPLYGYMKKMPAATAFWPRGGRFTRAAGRAGAPGTAKAPGTGVSGTVTSR